MPTVAQFLFGPIATGVAVLACVGGVDGNHLTESRAIRVTPGTFSLLRENGSPHGPGGVTDALGEAVIAEHSLDVQFFNGKDAVAIDQPAGRLMNKIMSSVADTLVDTGKNLVGPATLTASLLRLGLLSASLRQCLFVTAEEARVVHELAVGQGQKRVQARIKTNRLLGLWQEVIFLFHREADEPLRADPVDAARLDPADQRPVQAHLDCAVFVGDFGQTQTAADDRVADAGTRIAETIVAVSLTRGKPGFSPDLTLRKKAEKASSTRREMFCNTCECTSAISGNVLRHLGKASFIS